MTKLVLIADDHDDAALALSLLLASEPGCETVCVRDGNEAIRQARLRRPDVAVLDVDMPNVSGLQAAEAIRAMYPMHPPLLVACTGAPFSEELANSHHFHLILQKPMKVAQLLRIVRMP